MCIPMFSIAYQNFNRISTYAVHFKPETLFNFKKWKKKKSKFLILVIVEMKYFENYVTKIAFRRHLLL